MPTELIDQLAAELAAETGTAAAGIAKILHALWAKGGAAFGGTGGHEAFRHAAGVAVRRGLSVTDIKRLSKVRIADLLGDRHHAAPAAPPPLSQTPEAEVAAPGPVGAAARAKSAMRPAQRWRSPGETFGLNDIVRGARQLTAAGEWEDYATRWLNIAPNAGAPPGVPPQVVPAGRMYLVEVPSAWAAPTAGASVGSRAGSAASRESMRSPSPDAAAQAGAAEAGAARAAGQDSEPEGAYYPGEAIRVPAPGYVLAGPKGLIAMVNRQPVVAPPRQRLAFRRMGVALVGGPNKGLTRAAIRSFGAYAQNGGLTPAYAREPSSSETESD